MAGCRRLPVHHCGRRAKLARFSTRRTCETTADLRRTRRTRNSDRSTREGEIMNAGLTEDREATFARARSADWCASRGIVLRGSVSVASETAWRNALEMATEAEYQHLLGHVRAAEIA